MFISDCMTHAYFGVPSGEPFLHSETVNRYCGLIFDFPLFFMCMKLLIESSIMANTACMELKELIDKLFHHFFVPGHCNIYKTIDDPSYNKDYF